MLSTNYSNNLQDATAAYKLLLTQPGQVAGLPSAHLASLAQQARAPAGQRPQELWRETADSPLHHAAGEPLHAVADAAQAGWRTWPHSMWRPALIIHILCHALLH